MAKGVKFLEERERNHFLRVEPDEWSRALAVLEGAES
jgi:transketolase